MMNLIREQDREFRVLRLVEDFKPYEVTIGLVRFEVREFVVDAYHADTGEWLFVVSKKKLNDLVESI